MKKQTAPFIRKEQPALIEGMAETPEEKAAMRRQIADARRRFDEDGRVPSVLPPQTTPLRSDARPKNVDDKLKAMEPMLEEEREVPGNNFYAWSQ